MTYRRLLADLAYPIVFARQPRTTRRIAAVTKLRRARATVDRRSAILRASILARTASLLPARRGLTGKPAAAARRICAAILIRRQALASVRARPNHAALPHRGFLTGEALAATIGIRCAIPKLVRTAPSVGRRSWHAALPHRGRRASQIGAASSR
jgi:hypothetical protein